MKTLKHLKFILILLIILPITIYGQGVAISNSGNTPHSSAMLDVVSSNKGMLIPRLQLTDINDATTIPGAENSLLVFNLAPAGTAPDDVVEGFYYWNVSQSKWIQLAVEPLADPEWSDSDNLGLNNFVFAKQALANGDTVVITDDGRLLIGTTNAFFPNTLIAPKVHLVNDDTINGNNAIMLTTDSSFINFEAKSWNSGDWNRMVDQGNARIIFSTDGNKENIDSSGLVIAPWNDGMNPNAGIKIMENGNVGIGIAAPTHSLHVNNSGLGTDVIRVGNDAYYNGTPVHNHIGGNIYFDGSAWVVPNASHSTNFIQLQTTPRTGNIVFYADSIIGNNAPPRRMTILGSNGNVGIGAITPTNTLELAGDGIIYLNNPTAGIRYQNDQSFFIGAKSGSSANGGYITITGNADGYVRLSPEGGSPSRFLNVTPNGIGIGTATPTQHLHVIGNILASGTVTPSDIRYKSEVRTLDATLEKVLNMRGVSYQMKDEFKEKGFGNGEQVGVIAQEIEKIYPQLIITNSDGYKGVDYSKFTPILIEAIKEQQVIIDAQKERINALEKNTYSKESIEDLQRQIDELKDR